MKKTKKQKLLGSRIVPLAERGNATHKCARHRCTSITAQVMRQTGILAVNTSDRLVLMWKTPPNLWKPLWGAVTSPQRGFFQGLWRTGDEEVLTSITTNSPATVTSERGVTVLTWHTHNHLNSVDRKPLVNSICYEKSKSDGESVRASTAIW